jgi:hypothetical protein
LPAKLCFTRFTIQCQTQLQIPLGTCYTGGKCDAVCLKPKLRMYLSGASEFPQPSGTYWNVEGECVGLRTGLRCYQSVLSPKHHCGSQSQSLKYNPLLAWVIYHIEGQHLQGLPEVFISGILHDMVAALNNPFARTHTCWIVRNLRIGGWQKYAGLDGKPCHTAVESKET